MSYVPAEYSERGLHGKYLKLDNYASGLDDCAIQLLELLDPRSPTLREADGDTCPSCAGKGTANGTGLAYVCSTCKGTGHV